MSSTELLRGIFKKLNRFKIPVIICGVLFALLLAFYAKSKRPIYTAKATVFPLTTPADNALSTSALSGLLGIEGAPKSFSSEASINIIELTLSRNVREKVAVTRVPALGNKTITELLINDINDNLPLFGHKMKVPVDSEQLAVTGGEILKDDISAKMSKNGVLEIYFTCPYKDLITPATNVFIDKLSQFYIDLKISKALADYNFTVKKIDSLEGAIRGVDKRAVNMQNTTFFTPIDKLEYDLPKENLTLEKTRVLRQRDLSVNNREEATWRLQKATPIISVLDAPKEPFAVTKSSAVTFGVIGFIIGCVIAAVLLVGGLIIKYLKLEINKSLFGTGQALPHSL